MAAFVGSGADARFSWALLADAILGKRTNQIVERSETGSFSIILAPMIYRLS